MGNISPNVKTSNIIPRVRNSTLKNKSLHFCSGKEWFPLLNFPNATPQLISNKLIQKWKAGCRKHADWTHGFTPPPLHKPPLSHQQFNLRRFGPSQIRRKHCWLHSISQINSFETQCKTNIKSKAKICQGFDCKQFWRAQYSHILA